MFLFFFCLDYDFKSKYDNHKNNSIEPAVIHVIPPHLLFSKAKSIISKDFFHPYFVIILFLSKNLTHEKSRSFTIKRVRLRINFLLIVLE